MSKLKLIESYTSEPEQDISIENETELADFLFTLLKPEPRVVIIEMADFGIFTLGVGLPYGCVQYSADDYPPYLMAVNKAIPPDTNDDIEFDSGGTPTPISKRYCLPYDQVVGIVTYSFLNRKLPSYVEWEAI